eukprot:NODE_49_length_31687_cov_0.791123.p21 type:complete len:110 gc:universal NODE_49_length_31687_cov_0.791123:28011-28340(+)
MVAISNSKIQATHQSLTDLEEFHHHRHLGISIQFQIHQFSKIMGPHLRLIISRSHSHQDLINTTSNTFLTRQVLKTIMPILKDNLVHQSPHLLLSTTCLHLLRHLFDKS